MSYYLCFFEDEQVEHFRPLIHTRPVYALRLGRRTIQERLRDAFPNGKVVTHARMAIRALCDESAVWPDGSAVLFLNGRWAASASDVLTEIQGACKPGEPGRLFVQDGTIIAAWMPFAPTWIMEQNTLDFSAFNGLMEVQVEGATLVNRLWDLLVGIRGRLKEDASNMPDTLHHLEDRWDSTHPSAHLAGSSDIWIGEGVRIAPGAILNAEKGPIVLDDHATVREGAIVRGPVYLGPHSVIKPRADIEGSAFGAYCKVGGEVHDVIMQAYANKGHEGFMGHAFIGSWCNLGAGTTISNLRNDYGSVSLYNEHLEAYEDSGRQFLGLIMGDHSKTSIMTAFNTGTVVGVNCNLYDAGFHDRYIPSFSWGRPGQYSPFRIEKALAIARTVKKRRNQPLTEAEESVLCRLAERSHAELA